MKRTPTPLIIRGHEYNPIDPSITQGALREKHCRTMLDLAAAGLGTGIVALLLCLPMEPATHRAFAGLLGLMLLGDLVLFVRLLRLMRRIKDIDPLVP